MEVELKAVMRHAIRHDNRRPERDGDGLVFKHRADYGKVAEKMEIIPADAGHVNGNPVP